MFFIISITSEITRNNLPRAAIRMAPSQDNFHHNVAGAGKTTDNPPSAGMGLYKTIKILAFEEREELF
jgi:hypothetical protein